ncbi:hypothetical protein FH972_027068 [Carpinus fangiana]|uniref:B box-type domain-containing protein n=1 Tax=Carpinus fangiana TaxID=176857 RepID=A0A5N6L5W3_9ROSI|nr:hypothetical protein FH972_027068 [Carpinus fangiana]
MKIQCDVCEKAPATVICCVDEVALCARCDIEVHAANKLASKHQRLHLQCLSNKLPKCDICQQNSSFTSSWAVDDLLQFSDLESSYKKEALELGEFEWLVDMGLFGEQIPQEALAAAEVPQLPVSQSEFYLLQTH